LTDKFIKQLIALTLTVMCIRGETVLSSSLVQEI